MDSTHTAPRVHADARSSAALERHLAARLTTTGRLTKGEVIAWHQYAASVAEGEAAEAAARCQGGVAERFRDLAALHRETIAHVHGARAAEDAARATMRPHSVRLADERLTAARPQGE